MSCRFILFTAVLLGSVACPAQTFFDDQILLATQGRPSDVYPVDLDGDGDLDVLLSTITVNQIGWLENLGGNQFGPLQTISTLANKTMSVFAADLDGDGDMDVLSASYDDDKIAWYQNLGGGQFGDQQIIETSADGAMSVYAADLDGDNDVDVLSASSLDNDVTWYENLGGGILSAPQTINGGIMGAFCVTAADVNGDGDLDVIAAANAGDFIYYFQNIGGGDFVGQSLIGDLFNPADGVRCVITADIDGDSDLDAISASFWDDKIAWYENLYGAGYYITQSIISTQANGPNTVCAADIDLDGDIDVLSSSMIDNEIAWYENLGGGLFGAQHVITNYANSVLSIEVADMNGDGDMDILAAVGSSYKFILYDNHTINIGCNTGATEICGNNLDDNCDGQIDEGCCDLVASATSTGTTCSNSSDGSITVNASGGDAPYTYSLDGLTFVNSNPLTNLAAGNYTVTIRDINDCETTSSVTVSPGNGSIPAAPEIINGPRGVCRSQSNFVFSVTPVDGATSYEWTLPAGATGSSTTNSISLSFSSTYNTGDLCVRAVNNCGQSSQTCTSVNVFLAVPSTPGVVNGGNGVACPGTSVVYSIAPVANASSYIWYAPNNSTITAGQGTTSVTITYAANFGTSGLLMVRAVNCKGNSAIRTLTVSGTPSAPSAITGPTQGVCAGTTQIYSIAAIPGAVNYTWTVPSGATINTGQGSTSINVTFPSTFTTGTVSVTASSVCGTSPPKTISIYSAPSVTFQLTGQTANLCGGGTFTYSMSAVANQNPVEYFWTAPPGCTIVSTSGASATLSIPPDFFAGSLCYSFSNACGVNPTICTSLLAQPQRPASVSGPTSVCSGAVGLVYTTPQVSTHTYTWTVPSGCTIVSGQGTNSITVNWGSTAGSISVRANNSCGISGSRTLAVSMVPSANPGTISGPIGVCPNQTNVVFSVPPVAGANSYQWTLPAGATGSSTTNSISLSFSSTYNTGDLCVSVVNSCGQSSQACKSVVALFAAPSTPGVINGGNGVACPGTSVVYTIAPVANASSYIWTAPNLASITAGQGTTSVIITYPANFGTSGSLSVRAVNCMGNSAERTLTVNNTPLAPGTITGNTQGVCTGITQNYSVAAINGVINYTWTVPAGVVINSGQGTASINVTFPSTFTTGSLSVTASSACGTSPSTSISVSGATEVCGNNLDDDCDGQIDEGCSILVASSTSNSTTCPNSSDGVITVNASGGTPPYTYSINGLTFFSSNQFTNLAAGTYTVTVQDANAFQVTTVAAVSLGNGTIPATPGTISGPAGVCNGQGNFVFSVAPVAGATSYQWTLPAGATGSSTTNTITLSISSTYSTGNLCVRAINNCGQSSQTCTTVSITPAVPPTPGVINGGNGVVCPGTSIVYSIDPVPNASYYIWTASASANITAGQGTTSVTISYPDNFGTSGAVNVRAVNCMGNSITRTLTLHGTPLAPSAIIGNTQGVCAGTTQDYSVAPINGVINYTWTVPAGAVINTGQGTTSINVTFPSTFTTGSLSVTASSACGTSPPKTISISSTPSYSFPVTGQTYDLCGGGTFTYTMPASIAQIATEYFWTPPAGCTIVSTSGASATLSIPSNYFTGSLCYTFSNACGVNPTLCMSLLAAPERPASISGPTSVCPGAQGLVYTTPQVSTHTYTWTVPAGCTIVSGQGTNTVTVNWGTTAGNMSVKANNSCGISSSRTLAVSLLTCAAGANYSDEGANNDNDDEISFFKKDEDIEIFPNPSSGEFTVRSPFSGTFHIENELGQIVRTFTLSEDNMNQVHMTGLTTGLYFIVGRNENKIETRKILVTN